MAMGQLRKRILLGLLAAFALLQIYQPERTNPPLDPLASITVEARMPSTVEATLRRACYDCHSHETKWPVYAYVAPASWLVADDVRHAREHLNFSAWSSYDKERKTDKLGELCEQITMGEMPLKKYTLLHPSAKLSEADKKAVCDWSDQLREKLEAMPAPTGAEKGKAKSPPEPKHNPDHKHE